MRQTQRSCLFVSNSIETRVSGATCAQRYYFAVPLPFRCGVPGTYKAETQRDGIATYEIAIMHATPQQDNCASAARVNMLQDQTSLPLP